MSATAHVQAAAPRLERPRRGRAIAGVCAGLGRHLNIDPVLVRIVVLALAFAGGFGLAVYAAGWLLIPEEGAQRPLIRMLAGRRIATVVGAVLLIAGTAATAGALVGDGLGHVVGWATVLAALGAWLVLGPVRARDTSAVTADAAVAAPGRRPTRLVAGGMLLATGVVVIVAAAGADLGAQEVAGAAIIAAGAALAAGAFLGASPWLALPPIAVAALVGVAAAAGVSLRGPIGERDYRPLGVGDLPGTYRLSIGQARLDLSSLSVPPGTTTVRVRVGIGQARITVPAGVAVVVKGHAGAGDVELPSGRSGGTDVDRTQAFRGPAGRTLVVDARVGLGDVRVEAAR